MLPEQLAWLKANVFADGKSLYGVRATSAYGRMRAAFHDQIRQDTVMPLWLEQKHVAAWLAKEIKSEKLKRKAASKPDNAEVTTAKKQKTTQKGKGKGKKKANALTKGGEASKEQEASESEDKGEEEDMEEEERGGSMDDIGSDAGNEPDDC